MTLRVKISLITSPKKYIGVTIELILLMFGGLWLTYSAWQSYYNYVDVKNLTGKGFINLTTFNS